MKRLISATLALSLLGGSAAMAAPYEQDGHGYHNNYGYRDRSYDRHDNDGAAIVAGVGIAALAVMLASQHHHYRDHDGWYNRDDNYYRDNRGYSRDYDRGDRGHYYGYGDDDNR